MSPLLNVNHVAVSIRRDGGGTDILRDVSFQIQPGSAFALVGESGSGKSTLCRALTRLLPSPMKIEGSVLLDSTDLLSCSNEELREMRRRKIRYIFQEPYLTLNPLLKIKTLLRHAAPPETPDTILTESLTQAGLNNASDVLTHYPHQLSVGMQQRVMIAMAIIARPTLIIADEPTSALDESLREEVLVLLKSLQRSQRMSLLLVTHDLSIARRYADFVGVLYQGSLVEVAEAEKFFRSPEHQYSRLLVESSLRSTRESFSEENRI
ncbi:MAG: ABC transporter ATP-binding protein [Ignavibacteriae bacterium]|nr:ABC transporter ATP-binding protein [Ignavibacteriota bacterium]